MGNRVAVLVVEDSPEDTLLVMHELRRGGLNPVYERVATADDLGQALVRGGWDIVISDFRLPGFGGIQAMEIVKAQCPTLPFIVVSGTIGEEAAVEAMRAGAQDYVMKDNLARLPQAVSRELLAAEARRVAERNELALHRREAILEAVRFAADHFLLGEAWEKEIIAVLARLGEASETDRVAIFENLHSPSGMTSCLRSEWAGPSSDTSTTRPRQVLTDLRLAGLGRWETELAAGEILHGAVSHFPGGEAEVLRRQGVRSLVVAPVFVSKVWWGFLRFDDEREDREWHHSELDAIRAAASMLGASIHQMQAEESIRESHRRLEMTLAELESSQRQLVQRERLAAVGQLAAGIAHDFNNTLGVIQLYSEMLLRECDRPKQKERVETILSQAHRAANLTQQVVDFSRKTVLTRRPLDLVPFIRDFVDTILPIMPKDIQLVADFGPVDYVVSADAGRLQQVLMNLALNARDAMPKGGTLRMRVDSLALQPQDPPPYRNMAPGNWVRIRVSDTGTGIDDQALPHIFEPFFTTKSLGKGTGLGLAQVYGIVKQHDGFIDVETRVGEGTTFVMYLPQESQLATDAIGPSAGESPEAHGETILIVEDDVDTLRVVCEVLQAGGYKTLQACDGQAALEILRSAAGDVDLVLSDMVMPSIGGLDLFRVMRKENPALRMILMTGHPLGEKGNAMPDTESLDSLQKPFTRDALLCKVRSVLER